MLKGPKHDYIFIMKPIIKPFQADNEYYFIEGCYINELSNDIEDEALSIAQARVSPGVTTQWHRLKSTTERYVIIQGQGIVEIGDLPPHTVTSGDVVIIPENTRQRITNVSNEDLVFLALCTPRFTADNYQEELT